MNYTLNLIDKEISYIQSKIQNQDSSTLLTESAIITVNKNLLKELYTIRNLINDLYPKLKQFY